LLLLEILEHYHVFIKLCKLILFKSKTG
jgi:hypothetical protein